MMKKNLFCLPFLFAFAFMNAQTVIWSDDFDDEDVSDWTLYDEDGDGLQWADIFQVTDMDSNPVTPVSLISRSWSAAALTPDNWIVSPAIDLTSATGAIALTWKVQAAAATWDMEHYTVYVATASDLATLEAATVNFSETYDDPANAGTQYDRELDLSSFAGETVYIAFRHHDCTDQDFLSIDDVTVSEGVLGISNMNSFDFTYYPNPVKDVLNISAKKAVNNIAVYNLAGQQVMSKVNVNNGQVDVASLTPGVYVFRVTLEGGQVETFKIIKR